ncbi:hypothetical protein NL108_007209 [Boleophthalmus pectinirostris]|uniref:uncharacterized protein LOC129408569 isoform X1 n=1 Tax=Boleophthalmus pectinirostris TaxID=150288 RepID=UPI002430B23F|nr:uncharacterized protein LOC129408569 isoform X1 [Boleophthalmus pectinirostris]KAJ0057998.1 hypothetical protein NL108_007209 [Boleophthalmus pectinirostris]
MRMVLFGILVFTQISKVCAEVVFLHVSESQSVELSCPITEQSTHLHLYHHNTHSQSTLLSLSRGEHPRVSPKHRGRVDLYGGLYSAQVNVTLLDLESDDTGLYLWEITEDNSSKHFIDDQKIFLLVESEEKLCPCSSVYPLVLFTISAATVLILLIICGLGIAHFVKPIDCPPNQHHRLRGPSSVYMEMSRKPQTVSENISDQISHLEEVSFPVYANPNYRQPQENYYACPRQLKMGD